MSTSTVSITANPATARRRPVVAGEKRSGLDLLAREELAASPGGNGEDRAGGEIAGIGKDLSHSIRGETLIERSRDYAQVKKTPAPNSTTRRTTKKGSSSSSKPEKPRWQTVLSVFTKNLLLLLVLLGLVQMIRRLALNSAPSRPSSFTGIADFEGRVAEIEAFVKTTTKMLQVQVEVVDRKIESEIAGLRGEVGKKIEDKGAELESELHKLDIRAESFEKSLSELSATEWLAKDDFKGFLDIFKKAKGYDDDVGNLKLDEVRAFAKEIVEREIEKHAADGLGKVDYALASGGATVLKHSEPYIAGKASSWFYGPNRIMVHSTAEKMLSPSFGEPGQCFPLKGSSGFVDIKLRTAIIPEAITLEHVAKYQPPSWVQSGVTMVLLGGGQSVAYDRSSAPKDCRVSGWLRKLGDLAVDTEKMFLLTEFTYDLEKSNAQTYNVLESTGSGAVDTIRLDFTSNHGSPSHTCIYRLRVHGYEPNSVQTMEMQS
ncbi:hypothetical protein RJ640_006503 [Escallonia rubra]|uniref:SUN domain-containing protein n=1 Tax=Escallonia rubra TaxID=112253 RepID=A0AA88UG66_9ASTE|nr:hypothetical protein RJ640_006503 [Escallonia rubra]